MMQTFSDALDEQLAQLGWSLWTELGVSGVVRKHRHHAIDPEPLIIYTAALQDIDPRLRDESTDWCTRYHTFISKTRLRNLLKSQDESTNKVIQQVRCDGQCARAGQVVWFPTGQAESLRAERQVLGRLLAAEPSPPADASPLRRRGKSRDSDVLPRGTERQQISNRARSGRICQT